MRTPNIEAQRAVAWFSELILPNFCMLTFANVFPGPQADHSGIWNFEPLSPRCGIAEGGSTTAPDVRTIYTAQAANGVGQLRVVAPAIVALYVPKMSVNIDFVNNLSPQGRKGRYCLPGYGVDDPAGFR